MKRCSFLIKLPRLCLDYSPAAATICCMVILGLTSCRRDTVSIESTSQDPENARMLGQAAIAPALSTREEAHAGDLSALFRQGAVTTDAIWSVLLQQIPSLADGDEAIVTRFAQALMLVENERHKLSIALCLLRRLDDATKAIPLADGIEDDFSRNLFISGIINHASLDEVEILVQFIDSITNDDHRASYSTQLLNRVPIANVDETFGLIEKLAADEVERVHLERHSIARLTMEFEMGATPESFDFLNSLLARLSAPSRHELSITSAKFEVDLKNPHSFRETAAKWNLSVVELMERTTPGVHYTNAVANGDIDFPMIATWITEAGSEAPTPNSLMFSLVRPFVGIETDSSFISAMQSLSGNQRESFAEIVGKAYGMILPTEAADAIREHVPTELRPQFDKGLKMGLNFREP